MAKVVAAHVYRNPIASADAESVGFLVDGHLYSFQMTKAALRRLQRQIEKALTDKSAASSKRKD